MPHAVAGAEGSKTNRGKVSQRQRRGSGLNPERFQLLGALRGLQEILALGDFVCKWHSQHPPCKVPRKATGELMILVHVSVCLTPGSFVLGVTPMFSDEFFRGTERLSDLPEVTQ